MSRLWREVAELLAPHKDGMLTADIAEALQLTIVEVRNILRELEKEAVVYSEGNSKGGRIVWFLDQYAFDIITSDRFRAKERKCLRCEKMFWSAHAGNRICDPCKIETEEDHGYDFVVDKDPWNGRSDQDRSWLKDDED